MVLFKCQQYKFLQTHANSQWSVPTSHPPKVKLPYRIYLYEFRNGILSYHSVAHLKSSSDRKCNIEMLKVCLDITSPRSRDSNEGIFKQFHGVKFKKFVCICVETQKWPE